jgi:hypothetical protein
MAVGSGGEPWARGQNSGMKLDRRKMRRGEFAIPETRSYPIPDRLHARLALGEANQDTNPIIRARVRRAVSKRFPELAGDARQDRLREIRDARR